VRNQNFAKRRNIHFMRFTLHDNDFGKGGFRLSWEAGLKECTADPPEDGSATVFKAEARRMRSKEFLIKKILRSLRIPCLGGESFFTENSE
jgi:hypothetical protein